MRRLLVLAPPVLAALAFGAEGPAPLRKDTLPARLDVDSVPLGLGKRPVPAENPLRPGRVALGRRLFFDPVLSADRTVACASCHNPERGFAEGKPRCVGGSGDRP